jgi:glutathione S-transferase
MIRRGYDLTTSLAASVARLGSGLRVGRLGPRPAKLFELYDFEACPFCRRVREALSMLDLDAMVYPCPRRGTRFRPIVAARGGRTRFPYLVDHDTGDAIYESQPIIEHLYARYGDGSPPRLLRAAFQPSSVVASAARVTHGRRAIPSRAPGQPLDLWSFESSPYCRLVREALCELELPYHLHNVAKGSRRRAAFVARSGKMMVPYLADPNTGAEMFESADIVRYLRSTYGVAS